MATHVTVEPTAAVSVAGVDAPTPVTAAVASTTIGASSLVATHACTMYSRPTVNPVNVRFKVAGVAVVCSSVAAAVPPCAVALVAVPDEATHES